MCLVHTPKVSGRYGRSFQRIAALSTWGLLRFQVRWGQLHHVPYSVLVHMLVVAVLASLEWSQGDRPTYADVLDIGETTTPSICDKDLAAVSTNPRQDTACFKAVGQLQHNLWLSYDQSSLRNCQWCEGLISVAQQFVLLIAVRILVNLERIIVRQRLYQPQEIIIALRQELSKLFPPI
jgi:hypothetical protein